MAERIIKIALDVQGMTLMDDYWIKACRGVIQYTRERTHWQILFNDANLSLSHKFTTFTDLPALGADGIIFSARDKDVIDCVTALGLPAVNMMGNQGDQRFPSVRPDDLEIGTMAARHFIDRGFSHLAYCGPSNWNWSAMRAKSFGETARDAGCDCAALMPEALEGTNHASMVAAQPLRDWITSPALREWIGALPKPVGIMGCYDQAAIHVLEACQDLGLRVPGDVSVIGVDNNLMVCESRLPSLTSIDLNALQIGYEAAAMLDKLISAIPLPGKHVIVPPRGIVTRLSSDLMAVEDKAVFAALAYISERFTDTIAIADVARAAGICKSHLERRFRDHLRCTVAAEIRRRRLQRAQTLLLDPSLTLDQIAQSSGLRRATYLVDFFNLHTGMSPTAWRKTHGRV